MKHIELKVIRSVTFTVLSTVLTTWSLDASAIALKDATASTPISSLDFGTFAITVNSEKFINDALISFSGYKNTDELERMQMRSTLKTSFVEGLSGPQTNSTAYTYFQVGKAVCNLNFKEFATFDSDDFVTTKNQTLVPELYKQVSVGAGGAIFLKDQYFYIYCRTQNPTIEYFNRAFKGVLKIESL